MSVTEMADSGRAMRVIAALFGFAAVALGAFGAHALRGTLSSLGTLEAWMTGSVYHLVHAAVLTCIALAYPRARISFWLFVAGIGLFCGSLYVYAVTGLKPLAMLAPMGGACLLAGWMALALGSVGRGSTSSPP